MNDYSTESPKPMWSYRHHWNFSPTNQSPQTVDREAQSKHFDNSVNAVSFGFVATAILISMFLVMAIFERFLRPRPAFGSIPTRGNRSSDSAQSRAQMRSPDKLEQPPTASSSYALGVSVVMPGQSIPTFIAHPVPLPCPREGIARPLHDRRHFWESCKLAKMSSSWFQPGVTGNIPASTSTCRNSSAACT